MTDGETSSSGLAPAVPQRDVFICHASADKAAIIREFVDQLAQREITYWLDEAELTWGHSLLGAISTGLENSRFVIVFLTDAFIARRWPEAELRAALSREISSGAVRVLPIMVLEPETVLTRHPFLRDKKWMSWNDGAASIVDRLERQLGRTFQSSWTFAHPAWFRGDVWLRVLPRLENIGQRHAYRIAWGRWEREGEHTFHAPDAVILAFRKIAEGESYPIHFAISPPAFVTSGRGAPIVHVNKGWQLVDKTRYGRSVLLKWTQSFRRDTPP